MMKEEDHTDDLVEKHLYLLKKFRVVPVFGGVYVYVIPYNVMVSSAVFSGCINF